jgi:hypothetical protein
MHPDYATVTINPSLLTSETDYNESIETQEIIDEYIETIETQNHLEVTIQQAKQNYAKHHWTLDEYIEENDDTVTTHPPSHPTISNDWNGIRNASLFPHYFHMESPIK